MRSKILAATGTNAKTISEIAKEAGCARSTASRHLHSLQIMGAVECRQDGRASVWSIPAPKATETKPEPTKPEPQRVELERIEEPPLVMGGTKTINAAAIAAIPLIPFALIGCVLVIWGATLWTLTHVALDLARGDSGRTVAQRYTLDHITDRLTAG
ncbi:MAG: ArsR/SmtB family transcription factor [Mycobacterium sp.]